MSNNDERRDEPSKLPKAHEGIGDASEKGSSDATRKTTDESSINLRGQRVRAALKANLGEDVYSSWFTALEFASFENGTLVATVPVKFLKTWLENNYIDAIQRCAAIEFSGVERVEIRLRTPAATSPTVSAGGASPRIDKGFAAAQAKTSDAFQHPATASNFSAAAGSRTGVAGLEGSPLDPRYTFDSFAVGAANRIAHAGAMQVAETVPGEARGNNPLYIHAAVGHGKSHLLHAVAWEVRRRQPSANVVYMTAERFRFQFVEALKAQDAMAFKESFRLIDLLLVDDMEFMHGEQTELEFDHIINALLDGGRQLVVASARAPSQLTRLNDRMRSRMQRGLVTEINSHDRDLRLKILERRVQEKRAQDPSFEIPRDVVELLADKLTESGRELEGAVTRLYATWQYTQTRITFDLVETTIRDLVNGVEPRRIKIEDILRLVSRHYGVSKSDILSPRRHRSVVWPRQIGMYLSKQLTTRSLPEIGRRFGDRDHTTVLHAIRKIEGEISGDNRLKEEIDELKRQLNIER
jgi:chromosomal replication initiator protein